MVISCAALSMHGQNTVPDDTSSVDKIIHAMYNVISGPAGQRDWARFKNLFTPDARLGATLKNKTGVDVFVSFTPDDYIKNNDGYFLKNGFTERELNRVTQTFGTLVQVFTTYEFESGDEKQRGINSVQVVYAEGRWWIATIFWTEETETTKIPKEYLPK